MHTNYWLAWEVLFVYQPISNPNKWCFITYYALCYQHAFLPQHQEAAACCGRPRRCHATNLTVARVSPLRVTRAPRGGYRPNPSALGDSTSIEFGQTDPSTQSWGPRAGRCCAAAVYVGLVTVVRMGCKGWRSVGDASRFEVDEEEAKKAVDAAYVHVL